jgi:hypothetical protein
MPRVRERFADCDMLRAPLRAGGLIQYRELHAVSRAALNDTTLAQLAVSSADSGS